MMVPLFAERWKDAGVTIDAVHPGVLRTDLGSRPGVRGFVLRSMKWTLKPVSMSGPPVADLIAAEGTGRYFQVRKEKPLKPKALDGPLAARLWADAEKVLGVP
jgi:hypothetical protein